MIASAAAMGWTPRELGACSVTDARAAMRGWSRFQGGAPDSSDESVEEGLALVRRIEARRQSRAAGLE